MPEQPAILDQARLRILRVLAQLEEYSAQPLVPASPGGVSMAEAAECQARIEAVAAASRTLLLDIQAALDTVQGTSADPDLSAGGSSNHGRN